LSVVCVCSPYFHLELRKAATNLEDIGDGDGVLGGLALGGENGDRGPRHCGLWALLLSSLSLSEFEVERLDEIPNPSCGAKRDLGIAPSRARSTPSM
jgi:hypothetical protein